jgi:twitching motility protein PilT
MNYKDILNDLLATVAKEGASDIHIAEGRQPSIRASTLLIPLVKREVVTHDQIMGFLDILLSPRDKAVFLEKKEIDAAYDTTVGRFRVNGFFQQGNIAFALRLIPRKIRSLAELNLPPILESFTNKQQGFFLVVGPVGQGKTTTLASLIEIINQNYSKHILTIEDPIEYLYEAKKSIIDQREVGIDTKDFPTGLTSMFREDIDVVLIGEMRDTETMATAVTAAETGHLVFSTLHTNNAAQTIDRIIDSFPANQQDQIRVQLASCLTGIFSQRLIPRISGGLIPAYELLINNSAVASLIRERRVHEINTVIETSLEQGMVSMERSLAELVRAGEITVENAYLHSSNSKVLEKMI